jgi:hypothetical protein
VVASENYEVGINGGYERLGCFERFDGRPAPSAQTYYVLPFRYATVLPPTMAPGNVFKDNAGTNAGTVVDIRYMTAGGNGFCDFPGSEGDFTAVSAATSAIDTSIPLIPQPTFVVQPVGADPSNTFLDSGPTAPRTLYTVLEGSASATHFVSKRLAAAPSVDSGGDWISGQYVIMSLFLRRRSSTDRRYLTLRLEKSGVDVSFVGGGASVVVDIATQTVVSSPGGFANVYAEPYGEGWYRWVIETTALAETIDTDTTLVSLKVSLMDDNQALSYPGDTSKGFQAAGVLFDKGDVLPALTPYRSITGLSGQNSATGLGYLVYRTRTVTGFCGAGLTQNNLKDSTGAIVAFASGNEIEAHAPTIAEHASYLKIAADAARALIQAVPGSGSIRGVWMYNGKGFAFRDDGAACKMYKSSASGWVEVTFAKHLNFDAGQASGDTTLVPGASITGLTSGATATIARRNIINPDWAGNVAVGTLVLTSVTGAFQNNEAIQTGGTTRATADGADYVPTWTAGGRYLFRTHNFYGAANKRRMYGVNGLNKAFEYDDVDGVLAAIRSGMTVDAPTRVGVHQDQLVLGFPGGSVQRSAVGLPDAWVVVLGTDEIGVGDEISDFLEEVGDSLFVFTRGSTKQIVGNVADGYKLDNFDFNNGAVPFSVQRIGFGIHLDDRGFASLSTSDRHGNYEANTFSRIIQPLVDRKLRDTTVTASVIFRRRNRYRCFFADGTFISIGVSGAPGDSHGEAAVKVNEITGHMVCDYGKVVRCACSEEDLTGSERVFFGSDDGYVYEAEKGRSFDGGPIRAGLRIPYHNSGRPERIKHYRGGRIEAEMQGQCTLIVRPDVNFGKTRLAERNITSALGGAIYDYTMFWEGFDWDQPLESLQPFKIGTDGVNVSLSLAHESDRELPHTLRAIVYQTTLRGLNRSYRVG